MAADPREAIAGLRWWHVMEVAPGVETPGSWDLRPTAELMPWPASLSGARCLDIGTMDGFWAFELERRGAAEVLAIDALESDHAKLKWRLLKVTSVSERGSGKAGRFTHHTSSPLASRSFTWKSLTAPYPFIRSCRANAAGHCTGRTCVRTA